MIYFDTFSVYPLLQFNQIPTSAAMLPAELAHRAMRSDDNEERARRIGGYILLEKMVKKYSDGFKSAVEGMVKPEFGVMFDRRGILPCLRYDSYGKPYFDEHEDIAFNISHSAHMAACVISIAEGGSPALPVGIDLQIISDDVKQAKRMADGYFSPAEKAKIAVYEEDDAEYCRVFTEIWTKKEALLKCLGVGLSCISQADTEDAAAQNCRFVATEMRELTYTDLDGKERVERYCLTVCEQLAPENAAETAENEAKTAETAQNAAENGEVPAEAPVERRSGIIRETPKAPPKEEVREYRSGIIRMPPKEEPEEAPAPPPFANTFF